MGEVEDEAIIEDGCGKRSLWCFARELCAVCGVRWLVPGVRRVEVERRTYPLRTPSICRSIHHTPGTPSMDHRQAFLPSEPIGSHWRTMK